MDSDDDYETNTQGPEESEINTPGPDEFESEPEEEEQEDVEPLWLAEHGPIAFQVYKDVWNEFYTYETIDCQSTIDNLSRPYRPGKAQWYPMPHQHPAPQAQHSYRPSNPDSQRVTIADFDEDESTVRVSHVYTDPTDVGRDRSVTLDPYPRYTTCTSATHNVLSDPSMHSRAKFFPYADEKEFDEEWPEYLEEFRDFAWQTDFVDPDLEMIQLEATRRLYYIHNYTYEQIDEFGMFKRTVRGKGKESLIWHASQRDPFWWPGASLTAHPPLQTSKVNTELSLYDEVTRDLINFCPRLSCAVSFCKAHEYTLTEIAFAQVNHAL
ncbi:hypothetical protein CVT25_014733 [Psilocybe cyanescens]|uniref:Uncharacterized protein n=1 Tax=Psilocybe cyanescens TaxID=93625 RepID=A0A409XJX0_PSICY|nr:hypothetical protein CVT25_014733 [Psilocybe cyanescens]